MEARQKIRMGVDVGGTFTDFALTTESGIKTLKLPTTSDAPEQAILIGVRQLLAENNIGSEKLDGLVHGTTLATNAIILRSGARTALLTTEGFRDVLEQGDESRFDQYDINIEKPKPLVPRWWRYTISERLSAEGERLLPLDEVALPDFADQVKAEGIESIAICFIHAHMNSEHEVRARDILQPLLPGITICLSSEVSPEIGEYERFSTTVANAYVRPVISTYLERLKAGLIAEKIQVPIFMFLSNGGLGDLETAQRFPIRLIESGPAGGAIFAANVALDLNEEEILAFDMGGTTAKICLIENGIPRRSSSFEMAREHMHRKGSGLPARIPVIDLVEIGAGGGSIAQVDNLKRLNIGPDSAGSTPGPASYCRGGEYATVTDADLILGRLSSADFKPSGINISSVLAKDAIKSRIGEPLNLAVLPAAAAISEMVEEQMASAAREHAREKGVDLRERSMVAFGGAAPLHAVNVARKLGISRIFIPEAAGVGSAVGFLQSEVVFDVSRSINMPLSQFDARILNKAFEEIRVQARTAVAAAAPGSEIVESRALFMRYRGQGHNLTIDIGDEVLCTENVKQLKNKFVKTYISIYRRELKGLEVQCVGLNLRASSPKVGISKAKGFSDRITQPPPTCKLYDLKTDSIIRATVVARQEFEKNKSFFGPGLIKDSGTTIYVPQNSTADVHPCGPISLRLRSRQIKGAQNDQPNR